MRVISQECSQTNPIYSQEYSQMNPTSVHGCRRKCPCRLWINCDTYVDRKRQTQRLKRKEYNIIEWYKNNFRDEYKIAERIY